MSKMSVLIVTLIAVACVGLALAAQNPTRPQNNPQVPGAPQLPGTQPQLPPGTATMSGTVVALGSNTPVSGARVELRRIDCNNFSNPPETLNVVAGSDGKFSFPNLRAGGWCIVATAAGGKFTPAEYQQRGYKGRGVTIPLHEGEKIQNITLVMAPTSAISGRITDRDGEPVGHARVQAMEMYYENGERRLYILQVVQSNDLGEYRFYWLPPGRYFVAAIPEDTTRQNVASSIPPPGEGGHREDQMSPLIARRITQAGEVIEETFVPVYYGNTLEAQRSTPIDVSPGATVTGMDISLRNARIRSWHIRGTVLNGASGTPAAGAQIRLMPREWTATVVMPNVVTDAEGHFDLKGVIPGSYVLYANQNAMAAPGQNGTPGPAGPIRGGGVGGGGGGPAPAVNPCAAPAAGGAAAGAAPTGPPPIPAVAARLNIEVGNSDVENVAFTLSPGFTVMGKVTLETPSGPGDNAGPRGMRVSLARNPDLVGVPAGPQNAIQTNGTFCLANVGQGDYRLYVPPLLSTFQWGTPSVSQQFQNTYIKSIRMGNADVLTDGLHLSIAPQDQINIVIGNGAKLEGNIVNEKREAVVNATIALVPLTTRRRMDLYRTTTSDTMGHYKFQGVPPGAYRAFAWESVERDAWQDPEFLALIEGRGFTVQVTEGGQASADLQVIPAGR